MESPASADRSELLQSSLLRQIRAIDHAFETRGSRLESQLPAPVARVRQVHERGVILIDADAADRVLAPHHAPTRDSWPQGDALVTARAKTPIAIATADCVPVLLSVDNGSSVAAAHAGWRGIAAGVLRATVASLCDVSGTDPSSLVAAVGPRAGTCCYRVGPEVRQGFLAAGLPKTVFSAELLQPEPDGLSAELADSARGPSASDRMHPADLVEGARKPTRPSYLCDLGAAAHHQLVTAGLNSSNIDVFEACTHCEPGRFHSYRRDGDAAGRMLAGIVRLAG